MSLQENFDGVRGELKSFNNFIYFLFLFCVCVSNLAIGFFDILVIFFNVSVYEKNLKAVPLTPMDNLEQVCIKRI